MEADSTLASMAASPAKDVSNEEQQDVITTVGRMTMSRRKTVQATHTGFSSSALSNNTISYKFASSKTSDSVSLDKAEGHFQTLFMGSDRPFTIEPTIIKTGPHMGRLAFVIDPAPTSVFRLFDLPPEIRKMIFESVVRSPTCVGVTNKKGWLTRATIVHTTPVHVNLLRVNKQIYEEATHLVYASNVFRFSSTTAACHFLTRIASKNRLSLRQLWIDNQWYVTSGRELIQRVAEMPELRRLIVTTPDIPFKLSQSVLPWFEKHGKSKDSFNRLLGLLRMHEAYWPGNSLHLDPCRQIKISEHISAAVCRGKCKWNWRKDRETVDAVSNLLDILEEEDFEDIYVDFRW